MNTDLFDSIPENEDKSGRTSYTSVDAVSAVIAFILGYLYIRWTFFILPSAGAFVFSVLLISGSLIYLKLKKIPLSRGSIAFISITFIFSFALIFSSNPFIRMLVMHYVTISTIYWFCHVCADWGKNNPVIDDMIVFNMLKAVFVMPFSCFSNIFGAFFSNFKKAGSSKKFLMIIGGLLIAVVPTFIVTSLLISADDAFRNITSNFISKLAVPENISAEIWAFVIGMPVAMYMFGLLYANSEKKNEQILTRDKNEAFIKRIRFTPELVVYTSVTPVCLVYVLFFLSQSAYFLSAFSNIIPQGFTYAEYARKGFFELCAVAVINLCVIIFISLFTKRNDKTPAVMKIYITVISVFTLVMIAIAISKMAMYIRAFGLTPMRIYPTWFMILLAVLFVLIIVRQCNEKLKFFPYLFAAFVILFGVLVFTDTDSIIANYNVDRYLSGSLDEVDINMIQYELSDSALPALLKLTEDSKYGTEAKEILSRNSMKISSTLIFPNFNFSSWQTLNKIKQK